MPATNLFSHLDFRQRDQLSMKGEWDTAVARFTEKGVIQNVNSVYEALRASGQFDEEIEAFDAIDFDKMLENNPHIVVSDGAHPFHFDSNNLRTAEIKDDGSCMIDLRGWAKDNGLHLDDWILDARSMQLLHKDAPRPSGFVHTEDDPLVALVTIEAYMPYEKEEGWSAKDVISSIFIPILERQGRLDLSDKLAETPWQVLGAERENGDYKYLNKDFEPRTQDFETVVDAQRDACDTHDIGNQYREFFQYFLVTDHFANLLKEQGMVVADVGELTIWGRESCGMAISMESYAQRMFAESEPVLADSLIRKIFPDVAAEIDAKLVAEKTGPEHDSEVTLG